MLILFSVSVVSAYQNDAITTYDGENITLNEYNIQIEDKNGDVLQSEQIEGKNLQIENTNNELISNDNQDKLSDSSGSFADLEYEIESRLDNVTVYLWGDYANQGDEHTIVINKDIGIDGNGHTIDARGISGIFEVSEGNSLTLKNIIFKNGIGENGGALYINAMATTCTIINCTFLDNQANHGGAIRYFSLGSLIIKDSIFDNNKVTLPPYSESDADGGAIVAHGGRVQIENTIFKNSFAQDAGGAIYTIVPTNITNCTFESNNADSFGGSLYLQNDNILIKDSYFSESGSKSSGGAIYTSRLLNVVNCTFANNHVDKSGGAIYTTRQLNVENSTFISNHVEIDGGAVYAETNLGIKNCTFENNYAENNGGAVYAAENLDWKESPSVFIGNQVGTGNSVYANKGGAVYASTFSSIAKGLIFRNNRGWYGGAIYIHNKNEVTFESCCFENNVAKKYTGDSGCGAAIYMDSSSSKLTLRYNTFTNNDAYEDKGVYNCGVYQVIENNWWGTNNPNFDDGRYLIEWHKIGFNSKRSDSHPLTAMLSAEGDNYKLVNGTLIVSFITDENLDVTNRINVFDVTFSSNKEAIFTDTNRKNIGIFTPLEAGTHLITAKVANQVLNLNVSVFGDFRLLQYLVDNAVGVLNLTRDYTYSVGVDNVVEGIVIHKNLIINGNGYTINGANKSRIFAVNANNVTINNVNFINGNASNIEGPYGGAIRVYSSNVTINNCNFTNNSAMRYGGAIYDDPANRLIIMNSIFNNNTAPFLGSAVYISSPNSKIEKSKFINNHGEGAGGAVSIIANYVNVSDCEFIKNSAKLDGGAIYLEGNNVSVSNSNFTLNNASRNGGAIFADSSASYLKIDKSKFEHNAAVQTGGAIQWNGQNGFIKDSTFRFNKASPKNLTFNLMGHYLTVTAKGYESYINAIHSDSNLRFSNITYGNYKYDSDDWITTDNPIKTDAIINETMTLVVVNTDLRIFVKSADFITDENGQFKFDIFELNDGNYSYEVFIKNHNYYSELTAAGNFTVEHPDPVPTYINIITPNGTEFKYGEIDIPFEVDNRTNVSVLITNYNGSQIIYSSLIDGVDVMVDLPVCDQYYNITISNAGNETHLPSEDSILFKVIKAESYIQITNLDPEITYGSNSSILFAGEFDCHNYNVTIYDANNNIVYSQIIWIAQTYGAMKIPVLNIGEYNITVTNLGNNNKKENTANGHFKILKADNHFSVSVNNSIYGNGAIIIVNADFDGNYSVKINSTNFIVNVVNGIGSEEINLGAGNYTANVTSNSVNYNNFATNTTFTIEKAQSHIKIEDFSDVIWNQTKIIRFTDDYPTKLNITIYDEENQIVKTSITSSLTYNMSDLDIGTYNLTVINLGNENITESQSSYIFNVISLNNVEVYVEDVDYGRELIIVVFADIDGFYTLDINGTTLNIEVKDGIGFDDSLELPAGIYYANATFDNPYYVNNITNATFTIFKAESNVYIYDIGDVIYGEDVLIEFYDDYPTSYNITVMDMDGNIWAFDDNNTDMYLIVEDLNAGEYVVTVESKSNENITGGGYSINFNVTKITPHINVTTADVFYPYDVVVNITSTVPGNYTIKLGNQTKQTYLDKNIWKSIVFNGVNPGEYVINVTFAGTENYWPSVNDTVKINVIKRTDVNMSISVSKSDNGYLIVAITLPQNVTGNITIVADGKTYVENLNGGTANIEISSITFSDEISISYSGDNKFEPISLSTTLADISPKLVVSDMVCYYNSEVDFEATLLDQNDEPIANVNITFTIAGEDYVGLTDANGVASINAKLNAGTYNVTVTNPVTAEKIIKSLTILKVTPMINVSTSDVFYPFDVIVNVISTVSGNYTIKIGNQTKSVNLDENIESNVVFPGLGAGEYVVNVTFAGTENYWPSVNDTVGVKVIKRIDVNMSISVSKSDEGSVIVAVSLPKNATGNITVVAGGKTYVESLTNGTSNITVSNITYSDEISIEYSGDGTYEPISLSTNLANISPKLVISDMTRGYNSGIDFKATLIDQDGKTITNTKITFTINGKKYVATTDANGVALINAKLNVGTYKVTVTNPVTDENITKTLEIVKRITGNNNVNTYYAKNYQYKLRIYGDDGKVVNSGVIVTVTVNGKVLTLKTDKNGYITLKFTKNYLPKTYRVDATYKGFKVSNKVVVKNVLKLKKVKVKKSAKRLVLKATLKEGKKALKGKKVIFKFKGKKYKAKTNKKGLAKVTIKKNVLKKLKVSKKVKYQATYLKNTVKRTAKVKR